MSDWLYMENPDLPEVDGRPAYQLVPDAPGVQIVQEARGWIVKDLPEDLDPDGINTGSKITAPPPDVPITQEPLEQDVPVDVPVEESQPTRKAANKDEGVEK
jgi:hypothetical protein